MKSKKFLIYLVILTATASTLIYLNNTNHKGKPSLSSEAVTNNKEPEISNNKSSSPALPASSSPAVSNSTDIALADIKPNIWGIEPGNLLNGGTITSQGDFLYFSNTSVLKTRSPLFRTMSDGETAYKNLQKQNNPIIIPIFANVYGEWIYYLNAADEYSIYKTKIDGSITEAVLNESAMELCVINDYIYFKNDGGLKRVKIDGTSYQVLNSPKDFAEFSFDKNYLYLFCIPTTNSINYSTKLYRMNLDGSNLKLISENDKIACFIPYNDSIYFIDGNNKRSLFRMKNDGTNKTKIINEPVSIFNISDSSIFYTPTLEQNSIYKVNLDGLNKVNLTSKLSLVETDIISQIYITDDYVFCISSNGVAPPSLIRFKHDGSLIKYIN